MVSVALPGVTIDTDATGGWALVALSGFTDSTDPRLESEAREFGHGDFGQDDVFLNARYVTVEGEFHSTDEAAREGASSVLKSLHGQEFEVAFSTHAGVKRAMVRLSSRVVWDLNVSQSVVPFEFTLKADDPRFYGVPQSGSTGVPTAGVGVADPIIDPFSEGAPGNLARVVCTNAGTAPMEPTVTVTGGLSDGFELRCLETARIVRVVRPILDGSTVRVDMGSGEVWLDGQSALSAAYIPVAEWFQVKPGESCTIQFTPLGVVSGAPTMTVEWADASW